eukprot:52664_1
MADFSDNDSFILIDAAHSERSASIQPNKASSSDLSTPNTNQLIISNAQLTQSIVSNTTSMDGWSEISAPASLKSQRSYTAGSYKDNPFNLTEKDYHVIQPKNTVISGTNSSENVVFSSKSVSTNNNDNNNGNNSNGNNNNVGDASLGSVGSRVPFSWAEITKIQPQFHTDKHNETHKPKVFDQTPTIRTRQRYIKKNKINDTDEKMQEPKNHDDKNEDHLPVIPEANPYATKSDLGKKIRKSGKRGSRLKFPNGRRGSRRNWRKRNQK